MLDGAQVALGRDLTQLEDRQRQQAREAFSLAVQEVWDAWWWQELMQSVCCQVAPTYNPNFIMPPGQVVYWPADDDYYQTFATNTLPPTTGGTVNAGWIKASDHYLKPVPEYDQTRTDYAAGNLVDWNGVRYVNGTGAVTAFAPDLDPANWFQVPRWEAQLPYLDLTGASIGPVGTVRSVTRVDPLDSTNFQFLPFAPVPGGIRLQKLAGGRPWIWYRRPTPVITGDAWDAAASYEATPTEQIVFN
jgi:hypothetical protein